MKRKQRLFVLVFALFSMALAAATSVDDRGVAADSLLVSVPAASYDGTIPHDAHFRPGLPDLAAEIAPESTLPAAVSAAPARAAALRDAGACTNGRDYQDA